MMIVYGQETFNNLFTQRLFRLGIVSYSLKLSYFMVLFFMFQYSTNIQLCDSHSIVIFLVIKRQFLLDHLFIKIFVEQIGFLCLFISFVQISSFKLIVQIRKAFIASASMHYQNHQQTRDSIYKQSMFSLSQETSELLERAMGIQINKIRQKRESGATALSVMKDFDALLQDIMHIFNQSRQKFYLDEENHNRSAVITTQNFLDQVIKEQVQLDQEANSDIVTPKNSKSIRFSHLSKQITSIKRADSQQKSEKGDTLQNFIDNLTSLRRQSSCFLQNRNMKPKKQGRMLVRKILLMRSKSNKSASD